MGLAELASQLEHAGRENDLEKIVLEVLHLPSLFEQTREELLKVHLDKAIWSKTLLKAEPTLSTTAKLFLFATTYHRKLQ